MRMSNDRDTIMALQEAVANGLEKPEVLDALIEPEMDEEGNYYGDYIKPDPAARRAVNRILAKHSSQKARMAQEKEDRIADQSYKAIALRALTDRKSELLKRLEDNKDDTEAKSMLDELNSEIDKIWRQPRQQQEPAVQPAAQGAQQGTPKPAAKADSARIEDIVYGGARR